MLSPSVHSTEPVRQLVYRSAALHPFTEAGLLALQAEAATKNAKLGVTGFLLYHHDAFVQLIEGPDEAIGALIDRIRADSRHREVVVLFDERVSERAVPAWSMGVLDIADFEDDQRTPLERLLDACLVSPRLNAELRSALIKELRSAARAAGGHRRAG
ncbi:MAG: BLUF domain-containing protein [Phycisphaerales bacterium]